MATYQLTDVETEFSTRKELLKLTEQHIYGSDRLGMTQANTLLAEHEYTITGEEVTTIEYTFHTPEGEVTNTIQLGYKYYELKNHLGNVLVTVTDRKLDLTSNTYFIPDIASVTDYYAFGMQIEKRSWSFAKYRYGFNGMEKTDEIYGEGNSYTAEYWEYDARLGRRFNRDPFPKTSQSPYACFNNNPIVFSDPTGLDGVPRQAEVQKGDGPIVFAKRNGVTIENLLKWNKNVFPEGLKKGTWVIHPGQKLNISDPDKPLRMGGKGTLGTGDDATSEGGNTGLDPSIPASKRGQELVARHKNDPIVECEKEFIECTENAILWTGEGTGFWNDWEALKKQFISKEGGVIVLNNIANRMRSSPVGQKLDANIQSYFEDEMIAKKGDYFSISFSKSNINPPNYTGVSRSLQAIVGGTQLLMVELSAIQVHGQSYTATLTYWLFDDYGVDEADFLKIDNGSVWTQFKARAAGCTGGIVAFWVLQHQKGYRPVKTAFKFQTTVTGDF